ncbi:hypothetical protein GQ55_9G348100 [Panicum hallii var. hallii]|uniref:Pectinesterase inhibitor domain-containing protein n=1 Tax=Panicum hallii var. hallii TaxID=1504633 RepID=A0A2T7C8H9_9POAL|nr:hypothetical protein GQ55_9G348100 [Panicum hallii var. hallii]
MAPHQARAISTHHLRRHLVLILLLTIAAVTTQAATMDAAAPAPSTAEGRSTESSAAASFLRARCGTTLYPPVCYDSLLPHASEFRTSYARLARVAADVAAAHLRALSTRVKDILHHEPEPAEGSGGRPTETAALRDCASTISSAANLARQSSAELDRLDASQTTTTRAAGGGSSRQARWEVSNAKTWLSAAMTNEGTCADGLEEAGATASPTRKEVTAGVVSVKQFTSNALALVNGIPL